MDKNVLFFCTFLATERIVDKSKARHVHGLEYASTEEMSADFTQARDETKSQIALIKKLYLLYNV